MQVMYRGKLWEREWALIDRFECLVTNCSNENGMSNSDAMKQTAQEFNVSMTLVRNILIRRNNTTYYENKRSCIGRKRVVSYEDVALRFEYCNLSIHEFVEAEAITRKCKKVTISRILQKYNLPRYLMLSSGFVRIR